MMLPLPSLNVMIDCQVLVIQWEVFDCHEVFAIVAEVGAGLLAKLLRPELASIAPITLVQLFVPGVPDADQSRAVI